MPAELNQEISALLEQHFAGIVDAVMGGQAKTKYNAVTTLAGIRGDFNTKMNRLEIVSEIQVPTKGGKTAQVALYVYFYTNDLLATHFREAAELQRQLIERSVKNDQKAQEYARKDKRPHRPSILQLGPYTALRDYNGWRWLTPDAQMCAMVRTLEFDVPDELVTAKAQALHAALSEARLYNFYGRLRPIQEVGMTEQAAEAQADRLLKMIAEWEQKNGLRVTYENLAGAAAVALHIKDEEGTRKPLRTTQEVAFYNRLKQLAAKQQGNVPLELEDQLRMALDLTPKTREKEVNLFLAMLTTHNVVRLLARPEQWSGELQGIAKPPGHYGHPQKRLRLSHPERPHGARLHRRRNPRPDLYRSLQTPVAPARGWRR